MDLCNQIIVDESSGLVRRNLKNTFLGQVEFRFLIQTSEGVTELETPSVDFQEVQGEVRIESLIKDPFVGGGLHNPSPLKAVFKDLQEVGVRTKLQQQITVGRA